MPARVSAHSHSHPPSAPRQRDCSGGGEPTQDHSRAVLPRVTVLSVPVPLLSCQVVSSLPGTAAPRPPGRQETPQRSGSRRWHLRGLLSLHSPSRCRNRGARERTDAQASQQRLWHAGPQLGLRHRSPRLRTCAHTRARPTPFPRPACSAEGALPGPGVGARPGH